MSNFRIKTCVLGPISTNCYLIYNDRTKAGVIVDPADNAAYILNKCNELGIKPEAVLLTHGHCDHISAVPDVRRAFHVPVYAGAAEEPLFLDPGKNLSAQMWPEQVSFKPDELLHDGDSLELLGFQWKVLETPGHTAGGICYYLPEEEVLLAGDTLFENSFGRTDLPTGSMSQLVRSIVDKLFVLPDDTMVYPGHGDPTTIGHEKRYNPVSYYNR